MGDQTTIPQRNPADGIHDNNCENGNDNGLTADEFQRTDHALEIVVGKKALRKLRARRSHRVLWFGLGMFGMIGWSIAVPMLLAITLGIWIDRRWPSPYSWTLMLLFVGSLLGCLNAWYWVQRERRLIERESGDTGHKMGRTR